jgi:hypothetical protein
VLNAKVSMTVLDAKRERESESERGALERRGTGLVNESAISIRIRTD